MGNLGLRRSLLLLLGRSSFGRLSGLLLLGLSGRGGLGLTTVRRGPEGEVVTQELHDQSRIAVGLFRERVELSDSVVESLLGKVASTIGRVEDLVVEHGEVESKTQADGVSGGQVGLSNVGGVLLWLARIISQQTTCAYLVGFMGRSGSDLALVARSELGEVTVVVTLPVVLSALNHTQPRETYILW